MHISICTLQYVHFPMHIALCTLHYVVPAPINRQRTRKNPASLQKDPKDIEIDFLKRELNIVKVNLLEHETEVNDLKRKNKVLADTVSLLENSKQADLSNKYSKPSASRAPSPASASPCQCGLILFKGSNSEHPLPDCQGIHDVSWLHSDCEKDCGLKIPLTSTANFHL